MDLDEEVTPLATALHQVRLLEREVARLRRELEEERKANEHLTEAAKELLLMLKGAAK